MKASVAMVVGRGLPNDDSWADYSWGDDEAFFSNNDQPEETRVE